MLKSLMSPQTATHNCWPTIRLNWELVNNFGNEFEARPNFCSRSIFSLNYGEHNNKCFCWKLLAPCLIRIFNFSTAIKFNLKEFVTLQLWLLEHYPAAPKNIRCIMCFKKITEFWFFKKSLSEKFTMHCNQINVSVLI